MITLPNALAPYALALKLVAVALIVLLAFGGGCSVQAKRDAADLAERDQRIGALTAQLDTAAGDNASWELSSLGLQQNLADCQKNWEVAKTSAASAVAAAYQGEQVARSALADFQRRWDTRSQSCGAALLDMRAACATEIGSY